MLGLLLILSLVISLENKKQDHLGHDKNQLVLKFDKNLLKSFESLMKGDLEVQNNPILNEKETLVEGISGENVPIEGDPQILSDCVDASEDIPELASFVGTAIEAATIFTTELINDPLSFESLVLEVLTIMADDDACDADSEQSPSTEKDKLITEDKEKMNVAMGVAGNIFKDSLDVGSKVAGILKDTAELTNTELGIVPDIAEIVSDTKDCQDPELVLNKPEIVAETEDCSDPEPNIVPIVAEIITDTENCNDEALNIAPKVAEIVSETENCQDPDSGIEKTFNVGGDKYVKVQVEGDPPAEFIENKDGIIYLENDAASLLFLQNIQNLDFLQESLQIVGNENGFLSLEKNIETSNSMLIENR